MTGSVEKREIVRLKQGHTAGPSSSYPACTCHIDMNLGREKGSGLGGRLPSPTTKEAGSLLAAQVLQRRDSGCLHLTWAQVSQPPKYCQPFLISCLTGKRLGRSAHNTKKSQVLLMLPEKTDQFGPWCPKQKF